MALVFFLDIYYCVIIAWTFFYFIAAFTAIPDLPWNTCGDNYFCTFSKFVSIFIMFHFVPFYITSFHCVNLK